MSTFSLTNLERAIGQGKRKAPAAKGANPEASGGPQLCGDIDMRIARDGTWHYMGSPIGRQALVRLFASVLQRDDTGDYWLVTPAEMCRIRVDDAPFTAVEMRATGSGRDQVLEFRTNVDDMVTAGRENPIRVEIDSDSGEPAPYIRVRDGLDALIVRSVFYDLVELGEEREVDGGKRLGIWSNGEFFEIGSTDDA